MRRDSVPVSQDRIDRLRTAGRNSAHDVFGGVWIAFIGFFILQASAIEAQINSAPQTIDARHIRDVMHPFTASVTPTTAIDSVAAPLAAAPPGTAYPVLADGEVQGLLLREVVLALPAEHRHAARAADLMIRRPDLTVITPDTPLGAAQRAIAHDRWGRALVVDDGILVGIVGMQDLARSPLAV